MTREPTSTVFARLHSRSNTRVDYVSAAQPCRTSLGPTVRAFLPSTVEQVGERARKDREECCPFVPQTGLSPSTELSSARLLSVRRKPSASPEKKV